MFLEMQILTLESRFAFLRPANVFFLRLKMTIVLAKLMAITVIKNHSQGIHEEEWHLCDLRKKFCAYGGIGSPILRKADLFLCKSRKYQIHFVKLILRYFSPYEVLK